MRNSLWKRVGKSPMRSKKNRRRRCNLCAKLFRDATGFQRFCHSCKEESEVFRFGGWMRESNPRPEMNHVA